MQITPVKTTPITKGMHLQDIADQITEFKNGDILAITSKIISIAQGRITPVGDHPNKMDLIKAEADYHLPENKYGIMMTIIDNILIPTAGIDESNANGHYILYPSDPFQAADDLRQMIIDKFAVQNVGVIVTDSRSAMMRRGVTGFSLAWAGFNAFYSYKGRPDVFGKPLEHTEVNIPDSLAAAAVYTMGEGDECTPMAIIRGARHIEYTDQMPDKAARAYFSMPMQDDIYADILTAVPWQKS